MTRRFFGLGAISAVAGAQVASDISSNEISADLTTPDVKRVGIRLRCLCGCAMTVGECNMVGCHYASPARTRIREMLKSGMSDDQIVAVFVKEEGIKVLAAPPATGFNWFGYSAPYILAGLGAGVVALVIKQLLKPLKVVVPATPTDPATLSKYDAAAAKDIAEIED